ncbi:MAG: galactose-1-phosphate uridylyltransferase [Acidimicrobiia bacterium]|nr:galactose-1-phosphate uridylyltransferase [Acidimicrobiia bacterium]
MPELRKDPVTGRWVIIATERSRRPSDFVREAPPQLAITLCPFCPGNEQKTPPEVLAFRNGGGANQPGWTHRVVPNKFPALRVEGELLREGEGIYDKMNGIGAHEVFIESPDHDTALADLPEKAMEELLWAFRHRVADLKKDPRLRYLMLFKNHGEPAGSSLLHSHSQLIALPVVPKRVREEIDGAHRYYDFKERCIYCDIVRAEIADGERVVMETEHFLTISPYAPRFPFECWIVPRRHGSHFENMDTSITANLAWVLRMLLRQMDKVLEQPAYNFMIHTAPVQDGPLTYYHWHVEVIPRLTRVAGFEWGTGFYINPTPPEESARYLREAGLV